MANNTHSIINVPYYQLMREADEGTGGFRDGSYLIAHYREEDQDYSNRKNYSPYSNYIRTIISALVDPLFRRDPVRTGIAEDGFLNGFVNDCTNSGKNLTEFTHLAARKARRSGSCFVVVENFPPEEQPLNMSAALAGRVYPYAYYIDAEDCVLAEQDRFGKLSQVVFAEAVTENGKSVTYYRLWAPGYTQVFRKFSAEKGLQEPVSVPILLGINSLPVVWIAGSDTVTTPMPLPPLYDLARINHAIYQLDSMIMEQMRNCSFPVLFIPKSAGGKSGDIEAGAGNAIEFDKDGAPPSWGEPEGKTINSLREYKKELITEMYRLSNMSGVTGVQSQTSGVAKEWDFRGLEASLNFLANQCEALEKSIVKLFTEYTNESNEFNVEYNRAFGVQDVAIDIVNTQAALDLGIGGEYDKAVKKKLASQMFRGDEELINKIHAEIDAQVMDAENANQAEEDSTDEQ